jgi:predicted acylesterase/phospholipase RssA
MIDRKLTPRPSAYDKKVSLVSQGGGALGSYRAGVYEALALSDYMPDWVAGILIGAINVAILAGNASENRVAQLGDFWHEITTPSAWWPAAGVHSIPGSDPNGNQQHVPRIPQIWGVGVRNPDTLPPVRGRVRGVSLGALADAT